MAGRHIAALALLALSACAEFPDLSARVPPSELNGPYPPLVPVETLLAQTTETRIADDDQAALEARAAALRAKAARLRRY